MDTVAEQTMTGGPSNQEQVTGDGGTTSRTVDSIMKAKPPDQGTNKEEPSGRKGFKFGKLREETSFQGNAAELEDSSVIIANPAYQEENNQIQKQVEMIKQEQADEFSLSSQDQKFTQGGGIVNRMYQDEVDAPHQWQEDEERNQEVLDEVTCDDCKVETDERLVFTLQHVIFICCIQLNFVISKLPQLICILNSVVNFFHSFPPL